MGQLEYFGHGFKWTTHKTSEGFEAIVTVDARVWTHGVYKDRKAAWRAGKAETDRQIEIWRRIIIAQADIKRRARKFQENTARQLVKFTHRQRMTTADIISARLEV